MLISEAPSRRRDNPCGSDVIVDRLMDVTMHPEGGRRVSRHDVFQIAGIGRRKKLLPVLLRNGLNTRRMMADHHDDIRLRVSLRQGILQPPAADGMSSFGCYRRPSHGPAGPPDIPMIVHALLAAVPRILQSTRPEQGMVRPQRATEDCDTRPAADDSVTAIVLQQADTARCRIQAHAQILQRMFDRPVVGLVVAGDVDPWTSRIAAGGIEPGHRPRLDVDVSGGNDQIHVSESIQTRPVKRMTIVIDGSRIVAAPAAQQLLHVRLSTIRLQVQIRQDGNPKIIHENLPCEVERRAGMADGR